tara:strand:+ start:35 stop:250 length:216 start_codon:yes stop_codon:yes gene_type:complete
MYAENREGKPDKVPEVVEEISDKKGLKGRKESVKKTKKELEKEKKEKEKEKLQKEKQRSRTSSIKDLKAGK